MLKISKIIYVYEDYREMQTPLYLTCGTKEQLEALKKSMRDKFKCKDIWFAYEEY